MNRSLTAPFVVLALGIGWPASTAADSLTQSGPQTFEYKIRHALYGDIGTYLNIVETSGDAVNVRSSLRIAVKFLGLAVYREEAERRERWIGDRLVDFRSVTEKNGERIEVTGEARGDAFVIKAPWGTAEAPSDVRPSNPWSAKVLEPRIVMSTTTGRLFQPRVRISAEELTMLDGQRRKLRRYEIETDKREFVWLDDQDVPVVFGTDDDGARVEFVLVRTYPQQAGSPAVRRDKLPPEPTSVIEVLAD
jgi:hypothetical protein